MTELEQFTMMLTLLCIPHSVSMNEFDSGYACVSIAGTNLLFEIRTGKFKRVFGWSSDGSSLGSERVLPDSAPEVPEDPDAPEQVSTTEEFYNYLMKQPVCTYVTVCIATSTPCDLSQLEARLDKWANDASLEAPPILRSVSVVDAAVDLVLSDAGMLKAVNASTPAGKGTASVSYARIKKAKKYGIPIVLLGKRV